MRFLFGGKKRLAGFVLAALVVLLGWWQREPVLAWHYVGQLIRADDSELEGWVNRVVGVGTAAAPRLLTGLESSGERDCKNCEAALVALALAWGAEDRRTLDLVEKIKERFAGFSRHGQTSALAVPLALLKQKDQKAPAALLRDAGDLLVVTSSIAEERLPALLLAGALMERAPSGQYDDLCRRLAQDSLSADDVATRVAAVRLVLRGPWRHDTEMLTKTALLLRDPVAEVRQAALLAVSSARDIVEDDALLPLLHDPDSQVQEICEAALRSRGLEEKHLQLARLISDDSPAARLQVVQHLRQVTDLDPGVWLRRLTQDSAPAVRAAAIRAAAVRAGQQNRFDLRDRLAEMCAQDPSPTVRQLARYYLDWANRKVTSEER